MIAEFYLRMEQGQTLMPGSEMRRVTSRMITNDWFGSYRDINSVAEALDRIATRIRFPNAFDNAIEDLRRNEDLIQSVFLQFYPELKAHVEILGFEKQPG